MLPFKKYFTGEKKMGFTKLNLDKKILDAIKLMNFSIPTTIQEECIPIIRQGNDLVGHSQTGSGKTAAFGIPLLEKVVPGKGVQALVLTPTRELAVQVKEDIDKIGKFTGMKTVVIYGGVGYSEQIKGSKNSEIIIATPGRLIDHLERGTVSFNNLKFVVLDEADRMLDMGFEKSVNKILSKGPKKRQTIMFSATIPASAKRMIQKYMNKPVYVETEKHVNPSLLKHFAYKIDREHKFSLLVHLLKKEECIAIVFCRTKRETDKIAKNLKKQGIKARPVHGDLSQNKRQFALKELKEGKITVLVATDVAARGLDIQDISHVYNYDIPDLPDDYTHRIGRTARAGRKGEAITIITERDNKNFQGLLKAGMKIEKKPLPEFEKIVLIKDEYTLPRIEKRHQGKFFGKKFDDNSFCEKEFDKENLGYGGGKKKNNWSKNYSGEKKYFKKKFDKNTSSSFRKNSSKDSNNFSKKKFGRKKIKKSFSENRKGNKKSFPRK